MITTQGDFMELTQYIFRFLPSLTLLAVVVFSDSSVSYDVSEDMHEN